MKKTASETTFVSVFVFFRFRWEFESFRIHSMSHLEKCIRWKLCSCVYSWYGLFALFLKRSILKANISWSNSILFLEVVFNRRTIPSTAPLPWSVTIKIKDISKLSSASFIQPVWCIIFVFKVCCCPVTKRINKTVSVFLTSDKISISWY